MRRTLQSSALKRKTSEEGRGRGLSEVSRRWQLLLPTARYVTYGYTLTQPKVTNIFCAKEEGADAPMCARALG